MTEFDRRGFLRCAAWAGTGVVWTMAGGVPRAEALEGAAGLLPAAAQGLSFVQISDSHIGFNKDANPDTNATLKEAIAKINARADQPAFILHTGDITHLSKPAEFDTAAELLKDLKVKEMHVVPGEHDVLDDNKGFLERYGRGTKGQGWYSFDHSGVHFVALINVVNLKAGGLGSLGSEQIEWLEDDLKGKSASTPIVVLAHMPLWSIYPEWGWGTDDSPQALSYLKRFGSVTVLNGHIHQVIQKVEGNISFYTTRSTAYPQPKPGAAPSPGPMKVPANELRSVLGVRDVAVVATGNPLAIRDVPLASGI